MKCVFIYDVVLAIYKSVLFPTHQMAIAWRLTLNSVPVVLPTKDRLARCVVLHSKHNNILET